jgi:ABC-2 type transport system permease protein
MTSMTATTVSPLESSPRAALPVVSPTRPAGALTTAWSVALRTARKFLRTPQLVVVGTIQGALFLLIFRYVFGGAIHPGPVPYVDFLVPGFLATSMLWAGASASAGVAEDVEQGFFDRLRSLPVSRSALVAGRSLADTGLLTWGLAISTAIAFAVGFRLHGDVLAGLAAFGLCVVYGFAFTWLFVCIGLVAGNAQAAQGMSLLVIPLTFVSSAYVPVDTMPGWLQPFAEHQPITAMTNAVRSLALGGPTLAGLSGTTAHWVVLSLLWSAGLVLVFAPLAVARYHHS